MNKKEYDFLIVGSGLSGAVFAHEAALRGRKCLVIDRRGHSGGNIFCDRVEGINVHSYGPHIFHTDDKKIWDYVNRFVSFNNYVNSPIANYKGEIYNLPFNMNTFSKMWNITKPEEAKKIIENQRKEIKREPANLEEQGIALVGRDIFEKFIKGYTEKQWGKSCTLLPPDIIKRLPVRFTYNNNYYDDKYQGIPVEGYNCLIDKLLENTKVILNTDYIVHRGELDALAETVIYTGRIDEYFDEIYGRLEYRSLSFKHEILDEVNYQGVAVVNYTDGETEYTRVIEHKHFEFGNQDKTVITKEFPEKYSPGKIPYYPINNEKNLELYGKYKKLAEQQNNVKFLGRLAEYKYYDMDDVISSALSLTDEIFSL